MARPRIGIIGGSGLGQAFCAQVGGEGPKAHENPPCPPLSEGGQTAGATHEPAGGRDARPPACEEVNVDTPFGPTSGPILITSWEGVEIAFLSRHGPGHLLNPSAVPYRANIYALKTLGVTHILASGATGSLKEEIRPGHLVICDQVIDKTHRRESTFFDAGIVAHVEFAEPFCPALRSLLIEAGGAAGGTVHAGGTYVCMEGPAFSTVAESRMYRQWGGDLIGMTCLPEAKLAREAEMCYALIGLPTDYDCWRPHQAGVDRMALLKEIIGNLDAATRQAIALLRVAVPRLARQVDQPCGCRDALALAIWSDKSRVPAEVVEWMRPIVGRYF
jgi:5'-methylthioadenosine phosphorylase